MNDNLSAEEPLEQLRIGRAIERQYRHQLQQLQLARRAILAALDRVADIVVDGDLDLFAKRWADLWIDSLEVLRRYDALDLASTYVVPDGDHDLQLGTAVFRVHDTAPTESAKTLAAMLRSQGSQEQLADVVNAIRYYFRTLREHVESQLQPRLRAAARAALGMPEETTAVNASVERQGVRDVPTAHTPSDTRRSEGDAEDESDAHAEAIRTRIADPAIATWVIEVMHKLRKFPRERLGARDLAEIGLSRDTVFSTSSRWSSDDVRGVGTRVRAYRKSPLLTFVVHKWSPRTLPKHLANR